MHLRRRLTPAAPRPVTAIVSAVAIIASGVVGLQSQGVLLTDGEGIDPVSASLSTDSLAAGENVTVDDPAIQTQGTGSGPRTVKQFHRDQPFSQFALAWEGEKDIAAFVRAQRADGSWSQWYDTEALDFGDGSSSKRGTDLIYIEPTNTVQVSVSGVELVSKEQQESKQAEQDEQAKQKQSEAKQDATSKPDTGAGTKSKDAEKSQGGTALPSNFGNIKPVAKAEDLNRPKNAPAASDAQASDLEVVFVDGGESEIPQNRISLAADSDGLPRVISRKGWGADESKRCQSPEYFDGVKGLVVHHTAGSNNYSASQAPGIVRGIYQYHAQTLGWCDIGYQSLADKYGNLYEGRAGGLNKDVWGAHAGGFNENTWAVSMIGNYDIAPTTEPMIRAVGEILGWRAAVAKLDPTGSGTHTSEGSSYTMYPYGTQVKLPNIFAHRDVGLTTCPGEYGYAQMDNIRKLAKQKYDEIRKGQTGKGQASKSTAKTSPSTTVTSTEAAKPSATSKPSAKPSATASATASAKPSATKPSSRAAAQESKTSTPSSATKQPSASKEPGATASAKPGAHNEASSKQTMSAEEFLSSLSKRNGNGQLSQDANSLIKLGLEAARGNSSLELGHIGDLTVVNGLTIDDLRRVLTSLANASDQPLSAKDQSAIAGLWKQFERWLGNAVSGKFTVKEAGDDISYAVFDHGIVVDSNAAGAHALWGPIANLWISQGLNAGPLGLPTSNVERTESGAYRVTFQGGVVTLDPTTGKTSIELHR